MQLMRLLGSIGEHLCSLPARADLPGVHAGLSFTMPRATEALQGSAQEIWITERLAELETGLALVSASQPPLRRLLPQLRDVCAGYRHACEQATQK